MSAEAGIISGHPGPFDTAGRSRSPARRPSVQRVRRALFISGAVRLAQYDEPVPLVKLPGLRVLLEDPQLQSAGAAAHGLLQQRGANAAAVVVGVDVEVIQMIL